MDNDLSRMRMIHYLAACKYFEEHPDLFQEYEKRMIKEWILRGEYPYVYYRDGVREVLDQLSLIPDKNNLYLIFMRELLSNFDIEKKNIVEIGGGALVNLSKRLHLKQKEGSITVYDPRIDPSIKSDNHFILKREKFTRKTPLHDTDLLVGLMPCGGITHMVDQIVNQKKDFMIWFCEGGPHGDYFDYYENEFEWYDSMSHQLERVVEENKMGKLKVKKYPNITHYPILYNSKS